MIRKATVHRFPYVIAFEKHEQHVLVLAVAHEGADHSTGSRARTLERNQGSRQSTQALEVPHPQHLRGSDWRCSGPTFALVSGEGCPP